MIFFGMCSLIGRGEDDLRLGCKAQLLAFLVLFLYIFFKLHVPFDIVCRPRLGDRSWCGSCEHNRTGQEREKGSCMHVSF